MVKIMKLDDWIVDLINDGVGKFDPLDEKNVSYVEAEQTEDKTIIKVQNEEISPEDFLNLIKTYKDLNKWLYSEIFEKNA
jgi:hypothetical protein